MRATTPAPESRPPWGWALLGLCLGLLLTVIFAAPAHWLAQALARASDQHLLLQDPRGSLWDGSAQWQLSGGANSRDRTSLPSRLHWRLRPAGLGLRLELRSSCCTPQPLRLHLALGWGQLQLHVSDGQSHWPAALLAGLGTPWNTLRLNGQLAVSTQALSAHWAAGRWQLAGQAQLDALDLSSRLSTLQPIGSYRLLLQGQAPEQTPGHTPGQTPGSTRLQLSTLHGALQLSGQGQWVGQRLRLTGEASAAPGSEAALDNLLNIIGRRQGARSLITMG